MDYYKLLGVEKTATEKQIKTGYKKMVTKFHPDKVKQNKKKECEDKMKDINEAYSVLSDKHKKEMYDDYGPEGVNMSFPDFSNAFDGDIGSNFMGNFEDMKFQEEMQSNLSEMQDFMEQQNELKNQLMILEESITLEEAYNGKEVKKSIERNNLCKKCLGTGAKDKKNHECVRCKGSGGIDAVNPAQYEPRQRICPECRGTGGDVYYEKCDKCFGKKIALGKYIAKFYIPPGSATDDRLRIKNEGHMLKTMTRGDIHIQIKIIDHDIFKRDVLIDNRVNKINLRLTLDISLCEALCGFKKDIKHLDGRIISFVNKDIITTGEIKKIEKEGMPYTGQKEIKGDLFVKFNVIYPETLTEKQKSSLYFCLTNKRYKGYNLTIPEDNIEVTCKPTDKITDFGKPIKKKSKYDRDVTDSDEPSGCSTQ